MLNSVRLSLLLARPAVGAAPGLLPVADFPQVSSSRFRCAMVKRDYDDDLEKWTGDKEGAEDFDDAAIAEALSKFGKLGEHLYLQNAPPMNVGTFEEYCNLVYEAMIKQDGAVWEAKSRWPLAVGSLVPGSHANQPGSRVDGRHRAWRAGSRETRRLRGLRQAASGGPSGPSEKKQCCAERS